MKYSVFPTEWCFPWEEFLIWVCALQITINLFYHLCILETNEVLLTNINSIIYSQKERRKINQLDYNIRIQETPLIGEDIHLKVLMPCTCFTKAQRMIFLRNFMSPQWPIHINVNMLLLITESFIFSPCEFWLSRFKISISPG